MNGVKPHWWPDWSGQVCVAIASGPSATLQNLDKVRDLGLKCIAVCTSFQLAPWADVLVSCDAAWWRVFSEKVVDFRGLRISIEPVYDVHDVHKVTSVIGTNSLLTDEYGVIGRCEGNSGFYATNLAVQFGVRKIILVGFDMSLDNGVHWHGKYEKETGLVNPYPSLVAKWRFAFDGVAEQFKANGVEVVNVSQTSALTAYPKMSLEEALGT